MPHLDATLKPAQTTETIRCVRAPPPLQPPFRALAHDTWLQPCGPAVGPGRWAQPLGPRLRGRLAYLSAPHPSLLSPLYLVYSTLACNLSD